jgi:hypothetical protein
MISTENLRFLKQASVADKRNLQVKTYLDNIRQIKYRSGQFFGRNSDLLVNFLLVTCPVGIS